MKRIFLGSVRAVCGLGSWMGLALLGAPARAQPAAGGRAQVYGVTEADFTVPQVKLADAAVARRINRSLLWLVIRANTDEVDSLGTARQQLRQARRECCPNANAAGQGLTAAGYRVLLNQDFLLSFEFTVEFTGAYSWGRTEHATFDLRTGRLLRLTDLIADPPAQLTLRMQGAINRRMGEALAEIAEDNDDSAEVANLTERFHWNAATRRVNFETAGQQEATAAVDLEEFALTPQALLLFYRVDLPHVIQNFEPDGTYRFPYARVHPRGPLVPVSKAAALTKSK